MSMSKDSPPDQWSGAVRLADNVYYGLHEDMNPTFWHWCTTFNRWMAQGTENHTVTSIVPLTMTPSLLWTCCGLHGFAQNGEWVPA